MLVAKHGSRLKGSNWACNQADESDKKRRPAREGERQAFE